MNETKQRVLKDRFLSDTQYLIKLAFKVVLRGWIVQQMVLGRVAIQISDPYYINSNTYIYKHYTERGNIIKVTVEVYVHDFGVENKTQL